MKYFDPISFSISLLWKFAYIEFIFRRNNLFYNSVPFNQFFEVSSFLFFAVTIVNWNTRSFTFLIKKETNLVYVVF